MEFSTYLEHAWECLSLSKVYFSHQGGEAFQRRMLCGRNARIDGNFVCTVLRWAILLSVWSGFAASARTVCTVTHEKMVCNSPSASWLTAICIVMWKALRNDHCNKIYSTVNAVQFISTSLQWVKRPLKNSEILSLKEKDHSTERKEFVI